MHVLQARRIQRDAAPRDASRPPLPGVVRGLHFAATPTFAAMAILMGSLGQRASGMLCPISTDMGIMGGMALMYLLMAVFHAGPWITLLSHGVGAVWRRGDRP